MGHIVRQRPSEAKFALMKSLSLRTTRRKHLPSRRSSADIDNLHETFKAACWENRCPLKPLIDFACEPVAQNSSDS